MAQFDRAHKTKSFVISQERIAPDVANVSARSKSAAQVTIASITTSSCAVRPADSRAFRCNFSFRENPKCRE